MIKSDVGPNIGFLQNYFQTDILNSVIQQDKELYYFPCAGRHLALKTSCSKDYSVQKILLCFGVKCR